MSATQRPEGRDNEARESVEEHVRRTPDEDGPHDVPDDAVIEKTLPTVPVGQPRG